MSWFGNVSVLRKFKFWPNRGEKTQKSSPLWYWLTIQKSRCPTNEPQGDSWWQGTMLPWVHNYTPISYDSLILTWSVWVGFCDWGNDDWFFNVGLVFSILASARTSENVLYGLYTCNYDRFMLQWPAQLAIAGGNHRFQCARVQRDRGRRQIPWKMFYWILENFNIYNVF